MYVSFLSSEMAVRCNILVNDKDPLILCSHHHGNWSVGDVRNIPVSAFHSGRQFRKNISVDYLFQGTHLLLQPNPSSPPMKSPITHHNILSWNTQDDGQCQSARGQIHALQMIDSMIYILGPEYSGGPFYWHGLTVILAWISNYIHCNVWDEINYPFTNVNGAIIEVWEWLSNFIPHLTGMWLLIHVGT